METYLPKEQFLWGTEFNKALKIVKDLDPTKKVEKDWWINHNTTKFITPYQTKGRFNRVISGRTNIDSIQDGYIYPFNTQRNCSKIPDKFELNYDNGLFIGLFLAEGNIHCNNTIISNNDENVRKFVKQWFEKFNIKYTERERSSTGTNTSITIAGSSIVLTKFLKKFTGNGSYNKFVPNEAFNAPEEFILGLLNGYISGDGSVSQRNGIETSSVSQRLTEGISMLFNRIGVFGKMSIKNVNYKNNIVKVYALAIRSLWADKLKKKLSILV